MPMPGALLLLRLAAAVLQTRRVPHAALTDHVAVPSAAQLAWMDLEIGANICYGIGMPNAPWSPPTCSCYGNLTAPPAAAFNSTPDFAQWVSAFTAMGAKYSVIPASGGCGYALWPSEARFPDGGVYNYSVAQSPLLKTRDVMRSYVDAMRAHGIGTGVYFQLFCVPPPLPPGRPAAAAAAAACCCSCSCSCSCSCCCCCCGWAGSAS